MIVYVPIVAFLLVTSIILLVVVPVVDLVEAEAVVGGLTVFVDEFIVWLRVALYSIRT